MDKLPSSLKYIPPMLEFSFCVFLIMVATLFLIFSGAQIMVWLGIWDRMVCSRFPLFSFCLISTLLETVLAFLFSRIPLKPLRELIEATDRIADGDHSVRIDLKGPDEVRRSSQKFNHMAEEIGSVEMLRTDFVNDFSHEFKTPIVSIRGFAKALQWDDLPRRSGRNTWTSSQPSRNALPRSRRTSSTSQS